MALLDIGSRRELFVDGLMLESQNGTCLKLHEPVPGETAIKIDRPWEGCLNFGGNIIFHGGKYRMYYRAMRPDSPSPSGYQAVAESADGISWTKPRLQEEGTNFVTAEGQTDVSPVIFLDTRPGVPEEERFKGFCTRCVSGKPHTAYNDPLGAKYLEFYSSGDGYAFRRMERQPVMRSNLFNDFDGGCSMFWSEAEGQYVFYYRYSVVQPSERGEFRMRRTVARAVSRDLYHWSEPEEMGYSDTPEQFYTNNTLPYFRAPHIYIALAARFMERRRVLTPEQAKACGIVDAEEYDETNEWVETCNYNDCSDGVLLTTRAGSSVYDRTFMEAFVRPGIGYGNWSTRTNYPLSGIYPQDENTLMFYVSRNYWQETWHVQRMTLRTDGFGSLSAPWKGGSAVTRPFLFDGDELELNYRTSAAGSVRVELLDEAGNILPGFDAENCQEIVGDEVRRIVRWGGSYGAEYPERSVSRYAGKAVRMRFVLKDADVFSFKFNKTADTFL